MRIIDVSGIGTGAVFLLRGKANLLFEAGMAYAADAMVEAIERELGDDGSLDGVLLSQSHYDHVAGLPALPNFNFFLKVFIKKNREKISRLKI